MRRSELSHSFANLTQELLSTTKKVEIRTFTVSTRPSQVVYDSGTIIDLAQDAALMAVHQGKSALAQQFLNLEAEAKKNITSDELMSRFPDYYDSIMSLTQATEIMGGVVHNIATTADQSDQSWIERMKSALGQLKQLVTTSLTRVFKELSAEFSPLMDSIDALIKGIRTLKDKLTQFIDKTQNVVQHLSSLFSEVVAKMFSWLAKIKQMAAEQNFRLTKVSVSFDPLTFMTIPVAGIPVPIPEFKMPKIEFEFT